MTSEPLEKITPLIAENIHNRILSDIKTAKERMNKAKLHNIKSKLSEEETYALNFHMRKALQAGWTPYPLNDTGSTSRRTNSGMGYILDTAGSP